MAGSGGIAFSGIASGLDTSALIKSMMTADQAPVDGLVRQRSVLDTRISILGQLRAKMAALQSKVDGLRFQNQVMARSATTDTATGQPSVLSAIATSNAVAGSYKVWADQLATT